MTTQEGRFDVSGRLPGGPEAGRKFRLLLEEFPRADGEPFTGSEIAEATDHEVTGSYVSALKADKLRQPGIKYLSLIADVVGFPFELWRVPPELWDEYLEKHPHRGGFRSPLPRRPVPRVPYGEELARLLNRVFEVRTKAGGEPYSEQEVARRSRGRITAEEIGLMRSGGQVGPPAEIKLIGLSDAFGLDYTYWYAPTNPAWITDEAAATPREPDVLDVVLADAILESREVLGTHEKRLVLAFIRLLRPEEPDAVRNGFGVGSKETCNNASPDASEPAYGDAPGSGEEK